MGGCACPRVYSSGAGPAREFDLDDPADRGLFYCTVLAEADAEDVCALLDSGELRRLWPSMFLPRHVRRAWAVHDVELAAGS